MLMVEGAPSLGEDYDASFFSRPLWALINCVGYCHSTSSCCPSTLSSERKILRDTQTLSEESCPRDRGRSNHDSFKDPLGEYSEIQGIPLREVLGIVHPWGS